MLKLDIPDVRGGGGMLKPDDVFDVEPGGGGREKDEVAVMAGRCWLIGRFPIGAFIPPNVDELVAGLRCKAMGVLLDDHGFGLSVEDDQFVVLVCAGGGENADCG
jgi:hypothetical protein